MSDKETTYKGQSRILKRCHWCSKNEGEQKFRACSQCKEVIYCGTDCQRASWPFHKTLCKFNADSRAATEAADPELNKNVADFKKWHTAHDEIFKHAIVCALDLGNNPDNVESGVMFLEVKRKTNHAELSPKRKYEIIAGYIMRVEEAYALLGESGKPILDQCKLKSEYMKKKGGAGMCPIFMQLRADDSPSSPMAGIVDIVTFILPKPADCAYMQKVNDWGNNWFTTLAGAVQYTGSNRMAPVVR